MMPLRHMSGRHGLPRVACVLAAVQLAVTFVAGLNLMVCRSADGHVAVESALAACCTGHGAAERDHALIPDRGCDDCTDTPLLQVVLSRGKAPDGPDRLAPAPCARVLSPRPPTLPWTARGLPLGARAAVPDLALSARRSIVFLV